MWGSIHRSSSSSNLLLLVLAALSTLLLLSQPALSTPAASANLIHHEGGGGEKGNNAANALVAAVNANRTAARLPPLRNSKGLGCMALQYLSRCMASNPDTACSSDDTVLAAAPCDPPEADLTEVYAANCGVELPTVDLLSGRLLGCSSHLQDSSDNDGILVGANASAVVRGKEHTQVGAGLLRPRRHGPYFWCLLFSAGSPDKTFRLEAAGRGIAQARGCFSDSDDALPCNDSRGRLVASLPLLLLIPLLVMFC
ncbi:unnamed protein product [Alopecurus aequalis]